MRRGITRRIWLPVTLVTVVTVQLPVAVSATFTVSTSSASSMSAAAAFPTYPAQVITDGAAIAHRLEDAASGAVSSAAADSADGVLVASHANTAAAGTATGYWRFGGNTVASWPDAPTTNLVGTLDEIAVYYSQQTDQQASWHYHANH